ncbi:MAG: hypothetical protein JWQ40_2816 [Segetibacter sp.]|nr:hypothetical protein [Segetibacter sp.]
MGVICQATQGYNNEDQPALKRKFEIHCLEKMPLKRVTLVVDRFIDPTASDAQRNIAGPSKITKKGVQVLPIEKTENII